MSAKLGRVPARLVVALLLVIFVGTAMAFVASPSRELAITNTVLLAAATLLALVSVGIWGRDLGGIVSPLLVFPGIASGFAMTSVYLLLGGESRTFSFSLSDNALPSFCEAQLLALVGLCCFPVGYCFGWSGAKAGDSSAKPVADSPSNLPLAVTVLTVAAAFGWMMYVNSSGGVERLLANIHLRGQLRTTDYYRALFQLAQIASWCWFLFDPRATKKPAFWLHAVAVVIALLFFGARLPVVFHLVFFEVLIQLRHGTLRVTLLAVLRVVFWVALALFLTFAMLWWRNASIRVTEAGGKGEDKSLAEALPEEVARGTSGTEVGRTMLGQSNLPSMEILTMVVSTYPERADHLYGRSYAWVLVAPIPRVLWPEKPVDLGLHFNREVEGGQSKTGRPPSMVGELYINFSWIGAVLGSLAIGYGFGRITRAFWLSRRRPATVALFGLATFYLLGLWTKAEFKNAAVRFSFSAIGLALFWMIAMRQRPTAIWRVFRGSLSQRPPFPSRPAQGGPARGERQRE